MLARIAAGLSWANKPLDDRERGLALAYAAVAATKYLKQYERNSWKAVTAKSANLPKQSKQRSDDHARALWEQAWRNIGGFDDQRFVYILIAEGLGSVENLSALGQLPWSLVVDLDPHSTETGLHSEIGRHLKRRRGLHTTSGAQELIQGEPGSTLWLMACGWPSRSIDPLSKDEWFYRGEALLRDTINDFQSYFSDRSLKVVALAGSSLDQDDPHYRMERSIEVIDQVTKGKSEIFVFGYSKYLSTKE